jgi:hypothetical protein
MKRFILLGLVLALAGYAFAFDVKTDDKQEFPKFKVSGWLKVAYQDTVYHDTLVTYPSGFEVKDAAIVVSGDAWSDVAYRIYIQGNRKNKETAKNDTFLSSGYAVYSARLMEAYIDWKPNKLYSFRGGQYKKPFGMENNTAATSWDFINASQITSKFMDNNYDQGLMTYGKWNDLSYWFSVNNGSSYNYKDKNWAKDVIARGVYAPLAGLVVGGSVDYGTNDAAGKPLYRRRAGLEANYEWGKLFARGEFMIGADDKQLTDSLYKTTTVRTRDTVVVGVYDPGLGWYDTVYTKADTVKVKKYTRVSSVTEKLMRGAYLTVGYVPIQKLRVSLRGDLYREYTTWKTDTVRISTTELDTVWKRTEGRTTVWTLGADYFLNPNTKVSLNYDIKQEDLAYRPLKNNLLSLQLQAKF